jgi:hypothetical protein
MGFQKIKSRVMALEERMRPLDAETQKIDTFIAKLAKPMLNVFSELFAQTIDDTWRKKLRPQQAGPSLDERIQGFTPEEKRVLSMYLAGKDPISRQVRWLVKLALAEIWKLSKEQVKEKMELLGTLR